MKTGPNYLDPIFFVKDPDLLSGANPQIFPVGTEITRDIDYAMTLENSQDLPAGYRIWTDALENAVSPFISSDEARDGQRLLEEKADEVWAPLGDVELDLNKKQLKGTITEREEFWLTVAYDSLEILKSVALARYVGANDDFLEKVYTIYCAGFYPCGIRNDGTLVAFDPKSLKG